MCRACYRPETPKHLSMECRNNNSERHELRKNLGNSGLPTLLTTKKGIENTIQYLQKTTGGWGQLEQD